MPENRIYRPLVQIVRKYTILSAFILAFLAGFAQSGEKSFITKLPADTTVTTKWDNMVLMSFPVFTDFFYAKTQFDILSEAIPEYQAKSDSLEKLYQENRADLDSIRLHNREIISMERATKEQALAQVIRLDRKVRAYRRRNRIYKIIAGAAVGVAILK